MEDSMLSMSLADFTEKLSSRAAVPGGGGASALAASLSASLGLMVGNLTLGKKKYAENEAELKILMAEAEKLRLRFNALIDADAEAFLPLSKAYSIPKDDPERDETVESCLKKAASVPMEILRLSCRLSELLQRFAVLGSRLAISDAGTAAAFCRASMQAAALNVYVNTGLMKDRAYAEALNREVQELLGKYMPAAEKISAQVSRELLGIKE